MNRFILPFFLVLTFILLSTKTKSQSNLCFNSSTLTPNIAGNNPGGLTSADFNGDGQFDIAVANGSSNNISVLINIGGGHFANAVNYNTGTNPIIIKNGDFNEDGNQDLVVTNYNSSNISILLGNGNGTFNPQINYAIGTGQCDVICTDFNGDNHIDLALTMSSGNNISFLIGTGLGTFSTSPTTLIGSQPRLLESADFNGDGKKDLVAVNSSTNNVSVYIGNGFGGFSTAINYTVGYQPGAITCADFNNDGAPDLAITNGSTDNKIHVLINSGTGSFASAIAYDIGGWASSKSISAKDLNNDGNIDVVIVYSGVISIIYGIGNGAFLSPVFYSGSYGVAGLTLADFNNNGTLDIALSDSFFDNIKIYNNNGTGNFETTISCIAGKVYPRSFTTGDFNTDGNIDFILGDINGSDSIALIPSNGQMIYSTAVQKKGGGLTNGSGYFISDDFNNDTKIDVAFTGNLSSQNSLTVKLGNGNGNFISTNSYSVNSYGYERAITKADYNNDGNMDIAVATDASGNAGKVTVFLGTGNGTFASQTYSLYVGTTFAITSTDLNNDGTTDIAVGYATGSTGKGIIKMINDGMGGFNVSSFSTPIYPNKITSGDFNNDGKTDIVAASTGSLSARISIFLGTGFGSFATPTTFPTGGIVTNGNNLSIVSADFNNDGKLDLVNSNWDSESVSFHKGIGNGTFATPTIYTINSPTHIIPVDLNNDGLKDIAILAGGIGNVELLLNRTAFVSLTSTLCIGGTATLQATKGADFYTWNPGLSTSDTMIIANSGIYAVTVNYINSSCGVNTSSINVIADPNCMTVGLFEKTESILVSLFPNPTNNLLNITSKTELQKIEVTSITGQILLSESSKNNNYTLNLENYSNGIYFITIYDGNRIIKREKIVVNK